MAGHAPYLMPGGQSLAQQLRVERERASKRKDASVRAKDEQLAAVAIQRLHASSEHEAAELKLIAAAGVRRRRRWFNDKVLRDMAGPLSAADMEAQFKPAPFGFTDFVSPLTQAQRPEHAALWENFRNIDAERESRVLQKWTEHQREQRRAVVARRRPATPAEVALKQWARVGKKARAALKRANPSSVLQLELQVLDFIEATRHGEQLVLPMEDGFARLLVHGLAEFYSLLSASKDVSGTQSVVVYHRAPAAGAGAGAAAAAAADGIGGRSGSGTRAASGGRAGGSVGASPAAARPASGASPAHGRGGSGAEASAGPAAVAAASSGSSGGGPAPVGSSPGRGAHGGAHGASPSRMPAARAFGAAAGAAHDITCTDILLAMADVGQLGLNSETLQRYVNTHIHGTCEEAPYHLQRQL